MLEADVIGVVHDVSNTWTRDRLDPKVLRLLYLYPKKHSFLILNKTDAVKTKRKLLDVVRFLTNNSLARQSKMSEHEPSLVIDYTESREQQTADGRHSQPLNSEMNSSQSLSELQIQRKVQNQKGWPNFSEVFMVSALLGDGMNDIKDYLLHISEPSPWLYPVSEFTDQPSETVIIILYDLSYWTIYHRRFPIISTQLSNILMLGQMEPCQQWSL
uniref:Putative GTP-binding protein Era n=1 Tax=Coptotermes formosanus TaxID=36987 RepID=R4UNT3_COPFO|nr:putative GTP-binding protein Era [Coptotermes formosanus]